MPIEICRQVERKKMGSAFNAHEVFEIAEQLERNGARFYRNAASLFGDKQLRTVFNDLAAWEVKHEHVFAAMRKNLGPETPDAEASGSEDPLADPKAMAGLAVFGIRPEPAEKLTGKETRTEILNVAIEREKDSIVFYTGLKDFVPTGADTSKIDDIIKEEMRHIRILGQSLNQSQ